MASWFVAPAGRDAAQQLLVVVAAGCALVGHLVTVVGNVPLNNTLEAALHAVRTLLAIAAFVLMSASIV